MHMSAPGEFGLHAQLRESSGRQPTGGASSVISNFDCACGSILKQLTDRAAAMILLFASVAQTKTPSSFVSSLLRNKTVPGSANGLSAAAGKSYVIVSGPSSRTTITCKARASGNVPFTVIKAVVSPRHDNSSPTSDATPATAETRMVMRRSRIVPHQATYTNAGSKHHLRSHRSRTSLRINTRIERSE